MVLQFKKIKSVLQTNVKKKKKDNESLLVFIITCSSNL